MDAGADERFEGNPFVQGEPGVRFYVGIPVHSRGHPLGTLCALDTRPRQGPLPLTALRRLAEGAGQAIAEMSRDAETLS